MIFRNVDNLIIYNYIYLIYRTVNYNTGSREKLVETTKIINRNDFIGFDWMLNRFYRIIKRLQVIYEWKHYFVCILTCKIYPVNSWNFNCHLLCFIAIFIIFWQHFNARTQQHFAKVRYKWTRPQMAKYKDQRVSTFL